MSLLLDGLYNYIGPRATSYLNVVFTLAFTVLLVSQPLQEKLEQLARKLIIKRMCLLVALAFSVFVILINYRISPSWNEFAWLPTAVLVLAAPFVRRDRLALSALIALGVLTALVVHANFFKLSRSDLLISIPNALENWSTGKDAYAAQPIFGGLMYMPYWPGTLFSHLPVYWLGMDIRWSQVFYRAIFIVLLFKAAKRTPEESEWRDLYHLFLLSPFLTMNHDLYFCAFLALIAIFWSFPKSQWIVFPLMILTRQWALILAPFYYLSLWRSKQRQHVWAHLGAFVVLLSLTILALQNSSFETFVKAQAYHSWGGEKFFGESLFNYVPFLIRVGLSSLATPLNFGIAAVCLLFAFRSKNQLTLHYGIFAWIFALMLNYHGRGYFWLSPTVWLLFMGIAESRRTSNGHS
jgi:hypothetical protein